LTLFLVIMALATFFWPLLGVHRLLQEEKARLLGETVRRFRAPVTKLH